MDWEQLADSLNLKREHLTSAGRILVRGALVLGVSYVCAASVSAFLMSSMMSRALVGFNRMSTRQAAAASLNFGVTPNYREIEKAVKERNLFNSAGDFPDESSPDSGGGEKRTSSFDINAPCGKTTLNVQLVGTIYLEGGTSVATLQETGYSESDIYREGDLIVGNEQATIVKIDRNRVILNNNGAKECLELASTVKMPNNGGFPETGTVVSGGGSGTQTPPPSAGNDCLLEEKYVQDELGPGFGTIIQKARLVPNTADNQMNGFKIFAIEAASLLGKTGLQNGDVITQVNETSLKQPEQGFALYQAFQDEREVRIHILRGGTSPMMITCRIK